MNRSFSTFAKRFLLAASIGLVAVHSPMSLFAAELTEAKKSQAQSADKLDDELTVNTDGSDADENKEEEQPKTQAKSVDIKIATPPQAGVVDAKGNHVIVVPSGVKVTQSAPFPPGVRQVIEFHNIDGKQVQRVRVIDADGKTVISPPEGKITVDSSGTSGVINGIPVRATAVYDDPDQPANDAAKLSPYWIGAELRSLNPTMRWLLKLPDDKGVALFKVRPGSPAEKAGLKERDILIKVNDQVMVTPTDLNRVVGKSEGKEVTIIFIRGREGEEKTITVKPDKRPAMIEVPPVSFQQATLIPTANGFDIVREGVAVPPMAGGFSTVKGFSFGSTGAKLPDGLSISISRTGDKPAEIEVKQGEKSWEVKENELDKLPEEIRMHVQGLFSFGGASGNARFFVNAQPVTLDAARLHDMRMSPAEKVEHVRRLFVDLYGIPPTQQQLDDFFTAFPQPPVNGTPGLRVAPFTAAGTTGTVIAPAPHITTIPLSGGTAGVATPMSPGQQFTVQVPLPNAEEIQKQAIAHHQKVEQEIARIQAAQQVLIQKQMQQMQEIQKQVEAIQKQLEKK